jgi:hypothetical protein
MFDKGLVIYDENEGLQNKIYKIKIIQKEDLILHFMRTFKENSKNICHHVGNY